MGDVHRQFEDFAQIFENPKLGGFPAADNQFIFNGDLVDRGDMGVEILIVLIVAKLLCPNAVYMNRGNHEDEDLNVTGGFQEEVLLKYDKEVFDTFQNFTYCLCGEAICELLWKGR